MGKLLKKVNATVLVVILVVQNPNLPLELRLIARYNTIYKGITELICSRRKHVLSYLVNESEGEFVHGRSMSHNAIICVDSLKIYQRKGISSICIMEIDLEKAYYTVNCSFIEGILLGYGFPNSLVQRIMTCLSPVMFSVKVKARMHGLFGSK